MILFTPGLPPDRADEVEIIQTAPRVKTRIRGSPSFRFLKSTLDDIIFFYGPIPLTNPSVLSEPCCDLVKTLV